MVVDDDDVTAEEDIWDVTERQAIGSRVMCESVAEREYEGNITELIGSVAILIPLLTHQSTIINLQNQTIVQLPNSTSTFAPKQLKLRTNATKEHLNLKYPN